MKNKIFRLALILLLAGWAPLAQAAGKLRVVATVPDLVDITRRIGADLAEVQGLARGPEDIHQVVMKPSFVTRLNKADAVVYLGLSVEHSFLPGLLEVARNPKARRNADTFGCLGPGCIDCSEGVNVMEKPETLSRAEGELHPQGNPHYNLDPQEGPRMARLIAAGLARLDPEHAADYERNLKAYLSELEPRIAEWKRLAAALHGFKAVSFHKDVAYLGRFTGIDFVDTVELKPGIAPTPTHLEQLVKKMKGQGVKLIVREQQYDAKVCEWLAEKTGAGIAVIGTMANALPDSETFEKFSERNLKALLEAAGKRGP
ncbi:MAG: metal ABC transporter substrate-binding protein [Elusimicrobia bacterium]|nr:metal ABC transporter substrate-binding protein [Elusimicrobiota bacterium]